MRVYIKNYLIFSAAFSFLLLSITHLFLAKAILIFNHKVIWDFDGSFLLFMLISIVPILLFLSDIMEQRDVFPRNVSILIFQLVLVAFVPLFLNFYYLNTSPIRSYFGDEVVIFSVHKKSLIISDESEEPVYQTDHSPEPLIFFRHDCPHCQKLVPYLQRLGIQEDVRWIDVTSEFGKEMAEQLNVKSVPTSIIFTNGTVYSAGLTDVDVNGNILIREEGVESLISSIEGRIKDNTK